MGAGAQSEETAMDDTTSPEAGAPSSGEEQAGYAAPPAAPGPSGLPPKPEERPWYLRPSIDIWLGPLLIVACLGLRFGWNGIEGPPFPFWGVAYVIGAAGIFLTYAGWADRGRG
jgi:hypothetical protein